MTDRAYRTAARLTADRAVVARAADLTRCGEHLPPMPAARLDPAGTGRMLGKLLDLLAEHLDRLLVQVHDHVVRIARERAGDETDLSAVRRSRLR
ncbi:hypothetical protein [Pseudonocardia sp. ICBG601]|uniref:hypothetical protein n=1 Tax=Pseudonocardia sp. ICBG601 TaxID=2846759 RepID=UPI001CF6DF84|nr:hypothetical protein [Pseudonocardia sp. ICBG601]